MSRIYSKTELIKSLVQEGNLKRVQIYEREAKLQAQIMLLACLQKKSIVLQNSKPKHYMYNLLLGLIELFLSKSCDINMKLRPSQSFKHLIHELPICTIN